MVVMRGYALFGLADKPLAPWLKITSMENFPAQHNLGHRLSSAFWVTDNLDESRAKEFLPADCRTIRGQEETLRASSHLQRETSVVARYDRLGWGVTARLELLR